MIVATSAVVLVVASLGGLIALHRHHRSTEALRAIAIQAELDAQAPVTPPPLVDVVAKPPAPAPAPAPVVVDQAIIVVAEPPAAVSKPVAVALRNDPDRPLVIRRRQKLDQEALRRLLAELPELSASEATEHALIALHKVELPGRQGRSATSPVSSQERQRLRQAANAERAKRQNTATTTQDPFEDAAKPGMHVARDDGAPRDMLAMIQQKQPELGSLPWRMGDECHLGRESAEDLQIVSRILRNLLGQSIPPGDTRPDADLLRACLLDVPVEAEEVQQQAQNGVTPQAAPEKPQQQQRRSRRLVTNHTNFLTPAAIPALQQLLMAERTPVRLVLVDVLDKIAGREAARGLARLAMFDLAAEVRERALLALRSRSPEDYRTSLLEGLRYPWAPVADHAAEALVALGDKDAVADLVKLLDQGDPTTPRTEVRNGKPVTIETSLVQVNHLQNCVLCHAPSGSPEKDFVRGRVPEQSKPLPPPVEYYANSSPGLFVRADVTYLRQDFSVTQPVEQPGPWPAFQRYDYLVSERPASRWSRDRLGPDATEYPQRESVLFALRELTGRDHGSRSTPWKDEILAKPAHQ